MDPKERWAYLFIQAVPCGYRCRHCFFAPSKKYKAIPYERIIDMVQPFVDFRGNEKSPYGNLAVHVGDCALNHPNLPDLVAYMQPLNIDGWLSIASNGFRQRTGAQWQAYLAALRGAGTEYLEFTLYGKQATHDWFAGRKGSFTAIQSLAKMWLEIGGKTGWSLVIHKNNLTELGEIRAEIMKNYLAECPVWLWAYSGWGAGANELRIEQKDLEQLDPAIQAELSHVKSESEWVKELSSADEPAFSNDPQVMRIVLDSSGQVKIPYTKVRGGQDGVSCDCLSTDIVEEIMVKWQKAYGAWRASYPSLGRLCQNYSDRQSKKLYDKGSVIRKWSGSFEDEHFGNPEMSWTRA
jgi:hypothetical protein